MGQAAAFLHMGGGFFELISSREVDTCEVLNQDLEKRNAGHPHSMAVDTLMALVTPFVIVEHLSSPWYGLCNCTLGKPPQAQTEHILLLCKPDNDMIYSS